MKKIVLNKKQLKHLEEVNIVTTASDNSLSSFSKSANDTNTMSDIQKAKVAGDVNLTISGPKSNDDQPVQSVNVAPGQTVADAIGDQADDGLIRNGGKVSVTGDGLGESYIFTKKTLEEARLMKIRKDGRVMTKKELTESLLK
jgi:hypothetical protein